MASCSGHGVLFSVIVKHWLNACYRCFFFSFVLELENHGCRALAGCLFLYTITMQWLLCLFFVVFLSLFIESIYLERPFGQCYNQAIKVSISIFCPGNCKL